MSTKEILHQEQEIIHDKPNYGLRRGVALGIIGAVAIIGINKSDVFNNTINPGTDPGIETDYASDISVTAVKIDQDANIRFAPFVPNSPEGNTKATTMKSSAVLADSASTFTVKSIDRPGVNNDWIGINTADVHFYSDNKQLLQAADKDKSGMIWVSTQMADYQLDHEIN